MIGEVTWDPKGRRSWAQVGLSRKIYVHINYLNEMGNNQVKDLPTLFIFTTVRSALFYYLLFLKK